MSTARTTDADVAVRHALTRHAGHQIRRAVPSMALAIGLVAVLLWRHVDHRALGWWIAAGVADLVRASVRAWIDQRVAAGLRRAPSTWLDYANHALFGLLWGGLGVTAAWYGDDAAVWSALIVVLGVIAMATVVSAAMTQRFVVIVVCALGPTTAVLVQRPQWRAVAAAVVVFAGIATTVQRALHHAMADAIHAAEVNRELADQLARFLADRDPATRLLSRRGFGTALAELGEQVQARGRALTVVVANIERLAAVNELFGEDVGDALLCALAAGLAAGDVAPWFQPIVDATSGRVAGWEALVRWRHPRLGVLAPDRFLPLAMLGGHAAALTDAVLDGALAFMTSLPAAQGGRVHVNIDPSDLRCCEFPAHVLDRLRVPGVAAEALVHEITEQDVLAVDDVVLANLGALDTAGVEIAIDDFGTGYSSMSHLQSLPVRPLKIDRSFIAALDRPRASNLVEGIIGLARGMRLGVVAEGVETADQATGLAAMGCGELQGFLFSPALPSDEAAAYAMRTVNALDAPARTASR